MNQKDLKKLTNHLSRLRHGNKWWENYLGLSVEFQIVSDSYGEYSEWLVFINDDIDTMINANTARCAALACQSLIDFYYDADSKPQL